jgi:hypothetical protein
VEVRTTHQSTRKNSIAGGEFMDISKQNCGWLSWSDRIVRGRNRQRPEKLLDPGRREHQDIMVLDVAGIAQLVGNVTRRHESVACLENKNLVSDDDLQFSGEDMVRLILSRMGMARDQVSGSITASPAM